MDPNEFSVEDELIESNSKAISSIEKMDMKQIIDKIQKLEDMAKRNANGSDNVDQSGMMQIVWQMGEKFGELKKDLMAIGKENEEMKDGMAKMMKAIEELKAEKGLEMEEMKKAIEELKATKQEENGIMAELIAQFGGKNAKLDGQIGGLKEEEGKMEEKKHEFQKQIEEPTMPKPTSSIVGKKKPVAVANKFAMRSGNIFEDDDEDEDEDEDESVSLYYEEESTDEAYAIDSNDTTEIVAEAQTPMPDSFKYKMMAIITQLLHFHRVYEATDLHEMLSKSESCKLEYATYFPSTNALIQFVQCHCGAVKVHKFEAAKDRAFFVLDADQIELLDSIFNAKLANHTND